MAHESNLTALLALLPDDQQTTRDRVFDLLQGIQHWGEGDVWEEYRIRTTIFLGEMAAWLIALARGSQPPRHQDIDKAADERVLKYRRASLEAELELLNQEGDALELDDAGRARAQKIREELARMDTDRPGIPGPSSGTAESQITPS